MARYRIRSNSEHEMRRTAEVQLRAIEKAVARYEACRFNRDIAQRMAAEMKLYDVAGEPLGEEEPALRAWLRFGTGTTRN